MFDTVFWASPGGDFQAVPSTSTPFGSGTGPVVFGSDAGLIADVQAWVAQPATNFGWMLLGEESNALNARRIGSRENATIAPVLTIQFEPPPPLPEARSVPTLSPWSLILLVGLVVVAVVLVRRSK